LISLSVDFTKILHLSIDELLNNVDGAPVFLVLLRQPLEIQKKLAPIADETQAQLIRLEFDKGVASKAG